MREQRRVLHIIDSGGPGGAETVLDTIVARLPAERWRSRVVVPDEDWLALRLAERGVDMAFVPSGRTADVRYLRGLMQEIRGFDPSVIHTHLLASGVYGTLATLLTTGAPLVCTLHGRPDVPDGDPLRPLKSRILNRRTNLVAYVSHDLRRTLEPLLGLPARSGVVVHNGIEFPVPRVEGNERIDCGAGPDEVLIGAVGNVRPAKDYGTLIKAAAIVCRARPDVRFAIAGDDRTPLAQSMRDMVEDLGLSTHVRFLGFRSDVSALVSSFDIFVSSSYTEGLPLATVEAVALGTPVVLTRCGGVPEVVASGQTGLLVPACDPGALASGILETLGDPERTASMARAGAADVRSRFAASNMTDAYEALYEQLIRSDER